MSNSEILVSAEGVRKHYLKLVRRWRFVECLSVVKVFVNGIEAGNLKNGRDMLLPVDGNSLISLTLQSPAYYNDFQVQMNGDGLFEFGFKWTGEGAFRHNNIKPFQVLGCHIVSEEKRPTKLQLLDNWFHLAAMGICLLLLLALQLHRCHIRIYW